jgi:hypothetical protein
MSPTTRRLQWLFPVEREVYKTWRLVSLARSGAIGGQLQACMRCGSHVRTGDVGFSTRLRGTKWKDADQHHIHRRCIPTQEFERAGVAPTTKRRSA